MRVWTVRLVEVGGCVGSSLATTAAVSSRDDEGSHSDLPAYVGTSAGPPWTGVCGQGRPPWTGVCGQGRPPWPGGCGQGRPPS